MNWRVIAAVVAAFVLGGAAGWFIESQRVKDNSSSSSASSPTAGNADVEKWFGGTPSTSACPALKAWVTTFTKAAYTKPNPSDWPASRTQLQQIAQAETLSNQALLPYATAEGKQELQFISDTATKNYQTLAVATSADAYNSYLQSLDGNRLKKDAAVVFAAAKTCPAG